MTEEEILYQMACDFNYGDWCKVGSINVGFWSDVEGKNIAKYFAEKLAARDVEMQKQIEAVRGLIEAHTALFDNSIKKLVTFDNENAVEKHVAAMNTLSSSIVALNETLRPYGGVEKLA